MAQFSKTNEELFNKSKARLVKLNYMQFCLAAHNTFLIRINYESAQ